MAFTAYADLTPAQKKRRAAEARGRYLERVIRDFLELRGWLVEGAQKVNARKYLHKKSGEWRRTMERHDLFHVWDGIAVQGERRVFYQVTTLTNVARKRTKIERAGFPCGPTDKIYAYVSRPGVWRVLSGPRFEMPGEVVIIKKGVSPWSG